MALLDGGMLRRQKSWVKAEPPAIIVATVASLCQMVERRAFSLQSMRVLVIDERLAVVKPYSQAHRSFSTIALCMTSYSISGPRLMWFMFMSTLYSLCLHIYVTNMWKSREEVFLLISTDIASRGFDLPQTSHIYNFDLPKTATHYPHRAGRTGREPFSKLECGVTTLITEDEHFVLQRFQNELKFHCEELPLESLLTSNL
ncbi:DEAD-box ATP-dependent RNA helicase 58, chloroplastic-like [Phragmites australis]|uniref:DEAD-box ATP-dependent RNA helicase 58, chloroplastic-like n=1 Tax=Phragmites australis TaxID=29695 RepID=UPI002D789D19|nr:DEAD-box ATP-dependent RNA helicase 58, chloroplastic-like [Phragmites australis]